MTEIEKLLSESLKTLGIDINENQIKQFMIYKKLLVEWNEKMNLTAITEDKEVIQKHFVDCVSIASKIEIPENINVIDVGTGAGFPGIPVKIAFPHINITLLDSLNKRINFLEEVVKSIGLENVNCIHSRAEDGGQNENYREKYDMCISRAVANLAVLSEYCLPFVKVGGTFVSLKGPDVTEELNEGRKAIEKLGGEIIKIEKFQYQKVILHIALLLLKKFDRLQSSILEKQVRLQKIL